ncbi:WXG100 family type VII secretion target [Streptomyces sp. PTM05]|uniref:ESAT-6-like protein n=1 Tax=Streptantibioticus parmotrematis TaxID=2873249 RepID=A0ABS7QZD7_9ACTN|nr:WXG100 family type VII secretion target [Streptantibioticus parmotrematis]MBY8888582.1 WXG100 family type VII secretion target [Streptantibioticus parmotrematis]
MAANVNVTYQDMKDAATKLRTGQHDITQKLHDLQKYVNQLVNAGYVTDRSSKQFEQSYTEFNNGATKTIEGIDGMAKFLEQAAQTFQQADEQLAKGIGH